MAAAVIPEVGTRWRLKHDVDRFPHFIAPAGATGTVTDTYGAHISLRLDEKLPGAETWENEVVWADDVAERFVEDCERLDEDGA